MGMKSQRSYWVLPRVLLADANRQTLRCLWLILSSLYFISSEEKNLTTWELFLVWLHLMVLHLDYSYLLCSGRKLVERRRGWGTTFILQFWHLALEYSPTHCNGCGEVTAGMQSIPLNGAYLQEHFPICSSFWNSSDWPDQILSTPKIKLPSRSTEHT